MTRQVPAKGSVGAQLQRVRDRFDSPFHAAARTVVQRGLLKPLVWSLTRVTVIGRDKVKDVAGGFIVVANHSSHLDAPLIVGSLPRRLARHLATGAAADYFFAVWWRRVLTALFFNAFPVRRRDASPTSVSARTLLARGIPILLFPEGTRSKDGELGEFKPGAAALAAACDVPCIPMALIGAHAAHPKGSNWPKRGRHPVGVVFGEPLRPARGETPGHFTERTKREIMRLQEQYSASILGQPQRSRGARG